MTVPSIIERLSSHRPALVWSKVACLVDTSTARGVALLCQLLVVIWAYVEQLLGCLVEFISPEPGNECLSVENWPWPCVPAIYRQKDLPASKHSCTMAFGLRRAGCPAKGNLLSSCAWLCMVMSSVTIESARDLGHTLYVSTQYCNIVLINIVLYSVAFVLFIVSLEERC